MHLVGLVLFEGIPGSGKSTAAGRLSRVFRQSRVPHTWWYEEAKGHPLHTFHDWPSFDRMLQDTFSGDPERRRKVIDEVLDRWGTLGESLRQGGDVGILDGALFGHLTSTLFPAGAPNAETMTYVAEAERRVAPAQPRLIYLRQDDVRAGITRLGERRGAGWLDSKAKQYAGLPYSQQHNLSGFEGLVSYWQDYQRLTDQLFERSTLDKRLVTVEPADWELGWRQIAEFLDLPPTATESTSGTAATPLRNLQRFVGTYSYVHDGKDAECQVTLENGRLFINRLAGVWRHTPLVPLSPLGNVAAARFELESYPLELTLEDAEDGTVHSARLTGPQPFWGTRPDHLTKTPAPKS